MEIVTQGNNNRAECQDCGSLLQFVASDIMRRTVSISDPDYYEDGPENRYSVRCASCDMVIDVTDKITPGVARAIAERQRYEDYDL